MTSPPPLPPPFDPNKSCQPAWRQACQWLNQCHVLSPEANRILNQTESTIENLADILSDGIVLCNLLNYLVPGTINYTDVSLRPQKSRFLCLQNIRLFLDTCRRELNFRDRDLFDPYMLFDKYDLDKIIETLSKISRLDIAKKKNLPSFPITNPVNYVNMSNEDNNNNNTNGILPRVHSLDEAVAPVQETSNKLQRQSSLCHSCRYTRIQHVPSFHTTNISPIRRQDSSIMKTTSSTNLTESLSSSSLVAANAASALSSAAAITENHSNEFHSLVPKHRLSISSLPFSILNGDAGVYGSRISIADDVYEQLCEKPKQPDNHKAFLPRDHCVKELLDTELNYRDSLNLIVTRFIEPLQLKPEETKKIFLNITDIHVLHSKFYDDLRTAGRNEKGRTSRIVDLFTKWQDQFLIYAKYCSELPDAQEFLDRKLKQDSHFAQKLEQCRQKAGELGKFQLRDTVVLPFQRIVKYSLLLHTMKKNVPSTDHNGDAKRKLLEKAEQLMTDVNQYINEAKRAHDNLKVISNIEKTICDIKIPSEKCLKNYGRFIADDQFTVQCEGHRTGTRTVFLFDQVLLICKVKGSEKYTFRAALFIQDCQIEEGKAARREFPFILRDVSQIEFKFIAKTEEKRTYWLKILREAIDRCSNLELTENNHNFKMKSFDETAPRCDHCAKYLCGVFFQGYECSRCHKKLHRECVKKISACFQRASVGRISSFERGPIELPRAFSNTNHYTRFRALYDYDGTINNNNNRFPLNRLSERHIKVIEGDELEIIEDDEEHMWKVKNLRTNEIGLIPSTIVGTIDGDLQRTIQRSSIASADTSSIVCDCDTWYMDISRHQAEEILRNETVPNNTFLVRKQGRNEGHAISIKHNNEVYHIRIYTQEADGVTKHYLVDTLLFDSLQSLIQYYQIHSLEDRFPPVKSSLVYPIFQVCSHDILIQPATL